MAFRWLEIFNIDDFGLVGFGVEYFAFDLIQLITFNFVMSKWLQRVARSRHLYRLIIMFYVTEMTNI